MRKLFFNVLGIIVLVVCILLFIVMKNSKKEPKQLAINSIKTVFSEKVQNDTIPIEITNSGSLLAKNRIEFFSEVQGVFQSTGKEFKAGVQFNKGESIITIDSREHIANLKSQKSSLQNQITGLMSDLKLDYKAAYPKWEQYLKDFDVDKPLKTLPEATNDQEKFFLTGRNIYTTYYAVKNLEERLGKYSIIAPFDGVLTEAMVTKGSLIRAGQKLGEFISPTVFELEVAINREYMDRMIVGESVQLRDLKGKKDWQGKIIRVNGKLDQQSQTVKVFIQVNGEGLKEGMYLEAVLMAKEEYDAYEIDRKLLYDNNKIYYLQDSTLEAMIVNPIFFKENTVIVKGIENRTEILSKPVPGAYPGMVVKRYNSNK